MADDIAQATISNTDPPEVKLTTAYGMIIQIVLAQLAELALMGAATWLLSLGKISSEMWAGIAAYGISGNVIGKARGKSIVPATAVLVGFAPTLAKSGSLAAAVKHVLLVALVVLGAVGCMPRGDGASTIHVQALEAREDLNTISDTIDDSRGGVLVLCKAYGEDSNVCGMIRDAYAGASEALAVAQQAVDTYDQTGVSIKAVDFARRQLGREVRALLNLARNAEGLISDVANAGKTPAAVRPESDPGGGASPSTQAAATPGSEAAAPAATPAPAGAP